MELPRWLQTERGRDVVASIVVFVCTVATFVGAVGNDFVNYDDWGYVFDKRTLAGLTPDNIVEAFTGVILGNYHPLAWLSHMADVEVFGLDPRGHHAVNVVLHGLVSVVLLQFLRRLGAARVGATLLTLWFALHPLRVESVAWVSERKDLLCALFYFAAVWLWMAPRAGGRRRMGPIALATTAAMLSKPMAVSLPVAFALCEYLAVGGVSVWQVMRRTAPWFGLAALLAAVTLYAQSQGMQTTALIPVPMRLQTFFVAHGAFYLPAMVAPDCLYSPYLYPDEWSSSVVAGSVAAVAALSIAAWQSRRRAPHVALGIVWYLMAMVPVSGLVMVGIAPAADRYTYIPSVGLLVAALPVIGFFRPRLARWRGLLIVGGSGVIVSGALLTQPQIQVWRTTRALFEHALECEPEHPHVLEFLGSMDLQKGDLVQAKARTVRALALRPGMVEAWIQLGTIHLMLRDFTQARDAFVEVLSWVPDTPLGHLGLSVALEGTGESDAAAAEFEKGTGPIVKDILLRDVIARLFDEFGQPARAHHVRRTIEERRALRSDRPPPQESQ